MTMDLFEFGCACLELPYLKPFMDGVGLLGRGVTAPVIGLNLVAFGYYRNRPTLKRTGWAVLISLAMTALLVNLLKILLQMPRPPPAAVSAFLRATAAPLFLSPRSSLRHSLAWLPGYFCSRHWPLSPGYISALTTSGTYSAAP
jgi:hypothetical protein